MALTDWIFAIGALGLLLVVIKGFCSWRKIAPDNPIRSNTPGADGFWGGEPRA